MIISVKKRKGTFFKTFLVISFFLFIVPLHAGTNPSLPKATNTSPPMFIHSGDEAYLNPSYLKASQRLGRILDTTCFTPEVSSTGINNVPRKRISLSFGGSGYYFFYYLGIIDYLRQNYDLSADNFCVLGVSGGAIAAKILALNLSLKGYWDEVLMPSFEEFRKYYLGSLGRYFKVTRELVLKFMPRDAYEKAKDGRLRMSVTVIRKGKIYNTIYSQFNSNKEIVDTGYASGYIPGYVLLSFFFLLNGERCLDGGITNNQPILDKDTICVNPYIWTDLNIWGCLWPVVCMKKNAELVIKGFNDAKAHPEHWAPLEPFRHKKPNEESFIGYLERTVLAPNPKL